MQLAKPEPGSWNLEEAPPGAATRGMERSSRGAREKTDMFVGIRQKLDHFTAEDVADALKLYESITDDVTRATTIAYMRYSSDTADQKAKADLDASEELKSERQK